MVANFEEMRLRLEAEAAQNRVRFKELHSFVRRERIQMAGGIVRPRRSSREVARCMAGAASAIKPRPKKHDAASEFLRKQRQIA
jgi:hypothetical protein